VKNKAAPPPVQHKPRPPGRFPAILLAIAVHAAFIALIVFGVAWQSTPTAPVEVDLWDKLPPVKAAPSEQPEAVKPPPRPEPPKPEPPKPPEPRKEEVKPPPPKPNPAIALQVEREKREKEKLEKEKRERLDKQKDEAAKKQRQKEELDKKKREDEAKRAEGERVKAEAERTRAAAASARQSEVDRFKAAIQAKIRGRANVPDTVTGNPEVQVRIRILPGGEVLDIAITKRSGNVSYDSAIERAIRSASPLPVPPSDSELFPQFRDLNLNIRHER
jgi:colicin import membrane protein